MSSIETKLLIVDDEEDLRATLNEYLGKMGLQVKAAANLAEAQRLLRNETDAFDLVITDLRLPDGSGLDVLRAAHARKPETLITIVTGYASLESAIEAIRLGAYDYLTKPFALDQIGVMVRNMMQRVLLSKENARLSLRLQELYQEVYRLQTQRLETSRFHDEIRRELAAVSRKLDLLMPGDLGTDRAAAYPAAPRRPIAAHLLDCCESGGDGEIGPRETAVLVEVPGQDE